MANAGATLPKRDAIDARIVNDVKYGTGRVVNNASEVGGFIANDAVYETFEIPEEWLSEKGLTGAAETDITDSGYTVIEEYVNEWTETQSAVSPTNPEIVVQSPAIASLSGTITAGGTDYTVDNGNWAVVTEEEGVDYKAVGIAVGGNEVVKMALYDKNTLLASFDGNEIDTHVTLDAGAHYLTCRATNSIGEQTQSTTSIVYVKSPETPGSFPTAEIGPVTYKGNCGASMD